MVALVPFGIDKSTGHITEVANVPRGAACGCVCPSCGAELLARQGTEKEWHFAHNFRSTDKPAEECDLAFDTACRLFIIDMLLAGHVAHISLPALPDRAPRRLQSPQFVRSTEYGDVCASLGQYKLEVFITYSGRARPPPPADPSSTGVLSIEINQIQKRYAAARARKGVVGDIVRDMLITPGPGLIWLYHPRLKPKTQLLNQAARGGRAARGRPSAPSMPNAQPDRSGRFGARSPDQRQHGPRNIKRSGGLTDEQVDRILGGFGRRR